MVKNLPAKQEMWVQSLGQEDLLDKEMATQSSILAWEIPRTEEPSGLQSMELQRVGHNRATEQLGVKTLNSQCQGHVFNPSLED